MGIIFVKKAKLHIAGTYLTCEMALKYKFAYHLGGGMHHAMSFKPGGFCMFNDLVISLRKLQKEKKIKQAIIIDCHHVCQCGLDGIVNRVACRCAVT